MILQSNLTLLIVNTRICWWCLKIGVSAGTATDSTAVHALNGTWSGCNLIQKVVDWELESWSFCISWIARIVISCRVCSLVRVFLSRLLIYFSVVIEYELLSNTMFSRLRLQQTCRGFLSMLRISTLGCRSIQTLSLRLRLGTHLTYLL